MSRGDDKDAEIEVLKAALNAAQEEYVALAKAKTQLSRDMMRLLSAVVAVAGGEVVVDNRMLMLAPRCAIIRTTRDFGAETVFTVSPR